jgi:hypothetical protein
VQERAAAEGAAEAVQAQEPAEGAALPLPAVEEPALPEAVQAPEPAEEPLPGTGHAKWYR